MSGPMAKIVTFMVAARGSDGKRMVRANVEPEVLLVTTCTHRICSRLLVLEMMLNWVLVQSYTNFTVVRKALPSDGWK